ncbi:MAG: hypothetical protein IPK26_03865 [Planctomycetes bacterium]|nr:hypothetical protein [Planctomycetota bacterium]
MLARLVPFVLFAAPFAASLTAQSLELATQTAAAVATIPAGPVTDTDADGRIWVAADSYKASFGVDGTTFVPYLGAAAPRNFPTRFDRAKVTVGGVALTTPIVTPSLTDRMVAFVGDGCTERYRLDATGIEQQFVLNWLPNRGAVEVTVPVSTDFAVVANAAGHRFQHELGSFGYGRAVAIDGIGRRLDLETRVHGQAMVISVPQYFVAEAALPLLIDPLIGNVAMTATEARVLTHTDTAWDASLGVFAVIWERVWSATDSDVYLRLFDVGMAPVGNQVTIDSSTTSWRKPQVAGLDAHDRFLVVAEVSTANASPFRIAGRLATGATLTLGAQTNLAVANADLINPDVGGDPAPTNANFCLIFEHAYNATDHDIRGGLIAADLTSLQAFTLDSSLVLDLQPSISKSCGAPGGGTEGWGVAFQRDLGAGQREGRFAVVAKSGVPNTAPVATFGVFASANATVAVSSPTDHQVGRRYLFGYHCTSGGLAQRGYRVLDRLGAGIGFSIRASGAGTAVDRLDIDCDGTRFLAARAARGAADPFVVVDLLAMVGQQLTTQEIMSVNTAAYRAPSIVARHSGGSAGIAPEYALAWVEDVSATTGRVLVSRVAGIQDGNRVAVRNTGCGNLPFTADGTMWPGGAAQFDMPVLSGLQGFLAGVPVTLPIGPCPGCQQGADGNTVLGTSVTIPIPRDPALVGATLSLQPFRFLPSGGSGACLGQIDIGNTADFTVR